jgi:hypothetical protein
VRSGQSYEELHKSEWGVAPGSKVRHERHGEGVVERTNSLGQAEVKFNGITKTVPSKSLHVHGDRRKDFPLGMKKVWAI